MGATHPPPPPAPADPPGSRCQLLPPGAPVLLAWRLLPFGVSTWMERRLRWAKEAASALPGSEFNREDLLFQEPVLAPCNRLNPLQRQEAMGEPERGRVTSRRVVKESCANKQ